MERCKQWNHEKIKTEILNVMKCLNIDRMPTSVEMKKATQNTKLINAVRRYGGYFFWAKELDLNQSECTTRIGLDGELTVKNFLKSLGYEAEKMSVKHPYDLLVNKNVKIDVKLSKKYKSKKGEYYTFNLEKNNPTCDLYVFICDDGENRDFYVVPSMFLHQTQMTISYTGKYKKYQNRWDYIEQFDRFYKTVV